MNQETTFSYNKNTNIIVKDLTRRLWRTNEHSTSVNLGFSVLEVVSNWKKHDYFSVFSVNSRFEDQKTFCFNWVKPHDFISGVHETCSQRVSSCWRSWNSPGGLEAAKVCKSSGFNPVFIWQDVCWGFVQQSNHQHSVPVASSANIWLVQSGATVH